MSRNRHIGEAGEYDEYVEAGKIYQVDLISGSRSCPDEEHNVPAGGCKHYHHFEMELSQGGILDLDEETNLECMIAAHFRRARI